MSSVLLVGLPLLAALVTVLGRRPGGPAGLLLGVVLGQSLALLLCRRFPLTVLIVVTVLEAVLVVKDMELLVGFLAAACGLGAWAGRRQQQAGLVLTFSLIAVLGHGVQRHGDDPGYAAAGSIALTVLFGAFWGVGRLSAHQIRYSRRLEEQRARAEQRAAERERVLLARELHDILNHAVTAMVLDADATSETGDDAELREALRRLAATGRQSLAELRRLLGVLRMAPDSVLHDPLVVLPGLDDVDTLRVNNAPPVRSGRAPGGSGLGLVGMRERVALVGGTLSTASRADGSFEVIATFPMRGET
ncbi:histidine kinase [Actinoplanes sp. NPDC051470]|uniref:sensor histidine kinase n=1 Tax=Actinoplanes sp. NPDC051470 TaxID=3157224 RepID=UPI00344666A9